MAMIQYFSAVLMIAATCSAVDDQVLLNFYNSLGMQPLYPAKSCQEIYANSHASHGRSGLYYIKPYSNVIKVYCDMELSCGGKDGGWMRIGYINNGEVCPIGWNQTATPEKACRTSNNLAGCYPVVFNNEIPYQHVCGKLVGYAKGTPDAYLGYAFPERDFDGPYVDGVSITYGSPRKHLWTYAGGYSYNKKTDSNCPCSQFPGLSPPRFVSDNQYCESGSVNGGTDGYTVFIADPLWDGKGCSAGTTCCSQVGSPWFYRSIPGRAVTDPIEVRLCRDQDFFDEETYIVDLALFIQ